jgi:DNA polymerase-3 subunit delta
VLHVFHGADDFRSSEALAELRAELDSDGMLATNTSVLAGRGLTPGVLTQHAAAMPFLGTARLVIVEGLLTALGSGRGVAEAWAPFIELLPQLPPSNHLALIEPAPRRDDRSGGVGRSPLLRAFKAVPDVDVREFAELRTWARGEPSEVHRWLLERARARELPIEGPAVDALVDLIGANLRLLAQELEKLAAHAAAVGAPGITAEHVRQLTPQAREETVFTLVDAIVEGRAALALRLLRRAIEEGNAPPAYLQVMIARQLRQLVRATELLESHASQQEVAEATGVRGGFPLTKLMRQARQTSRAAVEARLRDLEAADFSAKSGRVPDELALELFLTAPLRPLRPLRGA